MLPDAGMGGGAGGALPPDMGMGAPAPTGLPALPAPPPESLIPSGLPGAAEGMEQENDDVGLELIDLVSELQSSQIAEQTQLLEQLLSSLGIAGASQNPLDGAAIGPMLETPDAGSAAMSMPAPGMGMEELTAREPALGAGPDDLSLAMGL